MSMEEKDYIIRQTKYLAQVLGKFLSKDSVNEILKQDEKIENTVSFNLGKAISTKDDLQALIKEGQIIKATKAHLGKLIIVEDEQNGKYILVKINDLEEKTVNSKEFKVKRIIE